MNLASLPDGTCQSLVRQTPKIGYIRKWSDTLTQEI